MPCERPACPWWQPIPGAKPLALTPDVLFDTVIVSADTGQTDE